MNRITNKDNTMRAVQIVIILCGIWLLSLNTASLISYALTTFVYPDQFVSYMMTVLPDSMKSSHDVFIEGIFYFIIALTGWALGFTLLISRGKKHHIMVIIMCTVYICALLADSIVSRYYFKIKEGHFPGGVYLGVFMIIVNMYLYKTTKDHLA